MRLYGVAAAGLACQQKGANPDGLVGLVRVSQSVQGGSESPSFIGAVASQAAVSLGGGLESSPRPAVSLSLRD